MSARDLQIRSASGDALLRSHFPPRPSPLGRYAELVALFAHAHGDIDYATACSISKTILAEAGSFDPKSTTHERIITFSDFMAVLEGAGTVSFEEYCLKVGITASEIVSEETQRRARRAFDSVYRGFTTLEEVARATAANEATISGGDEAMLAQAVKVRWSTMGFTENDANVAMGTVPRGTIPTIESMREDSWGTLPTIESMREDSSALPAPVPVPRPSADEFTLPGAPSAESQAVPRKLQCHHCLEQIWMPPSAHVVACPYCFTCNAVPESPDVAASSARSTTTIGLPMNGGGRTACSRAKYLEIDPGVSLGRHARLNDRHVNYRRAPDRGSEKEERRRARGRRGDSQMARWL